MKTKTTVFICHWHKRYRESLRYLTDSFSSKPIKIIDECAEFPECMEWLEKNTVDCVLIGFPVRIRNTNLIIQELIAEYPKTKFVIMSVFEIDELSHFYRNVGAHGHFGGNADFNDLIDVILN